MNFIPTPAKEHEAKIVQDFLLFERKLRLYHKLHKNEEDNETTDESSDDDSPHKILKRSKGWKPDDSEMDPNIMRYKTSVLNDMQSRNKSKRRPRFNTSKHERKAIRTLKKNTEIVIKPADKGGAIVIMDKLDYIKEGERQLQQLQHFKKLDDFEKTRKNFIKEVETSLRSLKNREYIDDDIFKILFRPNPRTSNLYLLPKIHKKNNPGRPIINSVGSLTETISALVDEILRKYSKLAKSYIKDTSHFLQEIQNIEIHPGDIIATVDVTALYTNIPHEDGIQKVKEFLKKHDAPQAELTLVETLLEHILKKNYFEFNNEFYLQISGTEMGTRCAPNYAIIFMAELEEEFLTTLTLQPRIWKRFIDDVFIIWNHGEKELESLLTKLNQFHPTIKFTEEHSEYGIPFLDTFTYIDGKELRTRVYHKPTDNKQYLHYNSCDPLQQKNSIPYSLLVRAKRICTEEEHFISEAKMIIKKLRDRKYPEYILERAVQKIQKITRTQLLTPRTRKEDQRIRYIISFNPSNPDMKSIALQHLHLLARMRRNPITQDKVQIVFRKSRNLEEMIITGLVNAKEPPTYRCSPCRNNNRKGCISYDRLLHTNTVTSRDTTHKLRGYHHCQSENCIYCLICRCCNKKYIGESSQTVNNRLRGHESHIKNYHKHPQNPVAQHFGINVNNAKNYNIIILDQDSDKNKRLRLEEAWIIFYRL